MATTTVERLGSRALHGGQDPAIRVLYLVHDAADEQAARAALLADSGGCPLTWPYATGHLSRATYDIDPMEDGTTWTADVEYLTPQEMARNAPKPVGTEMHAFDTSGETQHVTNSKQTPLSVSATELPATDHKGAIGVTDKSVEGCDIIVPAYQFSVKKIMSAAEVNANYKGMLFRLTGQVNDAAWGGFKKGEVLFLGASGNEREDGAYDMDFKFSAKPNRTNQTVGEITRIDYEGWNYVWILYAPKDDAQSKMVARRPIAVYVERVYDYGTFADLGIQNP